MALNTDNKLITFLNKLSLCELFENTQNQSIK